MFTRYHRLAVAGVIIAAATAVPAAALASGPGSPSSKPAPPQASAASAKRPEAKPAPPQGSAASGKGPGARSQVPVPAAVRALATRLGVSTSAAGPALKRIAALSSNNGGVDPASPAFAAIARGLGVSPAQLAAAWGAVGQGPASK